MGSRLRRPHREMFAAEVLTHEDAMPDTIVQLSDLHVVEEGQRAHGVIDTTPFVERAVAQIAALPTTPAAILLSGDLTDCGDAASYRRLRHLLAPLSAPIYPIPGNHDDRAALRSAFPDLPCLFETRETINYLVDLGAVVLIAMDSTEPDQVGGVLCPARLDWLASALDRTGGRPVFVAMHHPPCPVAMAFHHAHAFSGAIDLAEVLNAYPGPLALACGHIHRSLAVVWRSLPVLVSGSVAHQAYLDPRPGAALAFAFEPPTINLLVADHDADGAVALMRHVVPVGDFEGPFPFDDQGDQ